MCQCSSNGLFRECGRSEVLAGTIQVRLAAAPSDCAHAQKLHHLTCCCRCVGRLCGAGQHTKGAPTGAPVGLMKSAEVCSAAQAGSGTKHALQKLTGRGCQIEHVEARDVAGVIIQAVERQQAERPSPARRGDNRHQHGAVNTKKESSSTKKMVDKMQRGIALAILALAAVRCSGGAPAPKRWDISGGHVGLRRTGLSAEPSAGGGNLGGSRSQLRDNHLLLAYHSAAAPARVRVRFGFAREQPTCPPANPALQLHRQCPAPRRKAPSLGLLAVSPPEERRERRRGLEHFLSLYTGTYDNSAQALRDPGTTHSIKEHRRVDLPALGEKTRARALSFSLSFSLSLCFSVSVSASLCLSVSLSLSLSLSLSACLFLSVSLSLSLPLSVSL